MAGLLIFFNIIIFKELWTKYFVSNFYFYQFEQHNSCYICKKFLKNYKIFFINNRKHFIIINKKFLTGKNNCIFFTEFMQPQLLEIEVFFFFFWCFCAEMKLFGIGRGILLKILFFSKFPNINEYYVCSNFSITRESRNFYRYAYNLSKKNSHLKSFKIWSTHKKYSWISISLFI